MSISTITTQLKMNKKQLEKANLKLSCIKIFTQDQIYLFEK